jgi:hypothetical protein
VKEGSRAAVCANGLSGAAGWLSMPSISEIQLRVPIDQVWAALGGCQLRRGRGQAFWRGGDGYSVSLDLKRGLWFDHVDAHGGDVFALVRTALGCDFRAALRWLEDFAGISHPATPERKRCATDADWPTDLKWAQWWGLAAAQLAEDALESLPANHSERRGLTALLARIQMSDASCVAAYREWRAKDPSFTHALCHAGQRSHNRAQCALAEWINVEAAA